MSHRTIVVLALLATAACSDTAPIQPVIPPAKTLTDRQGGGQVAESILEVCKVAGSGVVAGETFNFVVTRGGVPRGTSVDAGTCAQITLPMLSNPLDKGTYRGRPALIAELLPPGSTLTVGGAALDASSISELLSNSKAVEATSALLLNLAQQLLSAELNILQGIQPTQAVLDAMAQAHAAMTVQTGPPIVLSTMLHNRDLGPLVDVISRFNEGKGGVTAASFAELEVAEDLPLGMTVEIACAPADQCSSANVSAAKVTARVPAGGTTRVTFTNALMPTMTLCQGVGLGIAEGQVYRYGYAAPMGGGAFGDVDVRMGECVDLHLPPVEHHFFQTLPENEVISSIVCEPADGCSGTRPEDLSAFVKITAGSNVRVTFTNESTVGTLRVCNASVPHAGTAFQLRAVRIPDFGEELIGTSFFLAPGQCDQQQVPVGRWHVIEDPVPSTSIITDITCSPEERCGDMRVDQFGGFLDVDIGVTTTITFTNTPTGPDASRVSRR